MAKYQTIFIAAAGLVFFPYLMYEKYKQEPEKLATIAVVTPIACGALFMPFLFYRRVSGKILQQISYDLGQRQLLFKKFASQM